LFGSNGTEAGPYAKRVTSWEAFTLQQFLHSGAEKHAEAILIIEVIVYFQVLVPKEAAPMLFCFIVT
jgi:hypothetical protein